MPLKNIQKATSFDPTLNYITDGSFVYQNGIQYPVSVLQNNIDQWFNPQDPDVYLQSFITDMQKAGWALASIAFASLLHINVTDYVPFAKMGQDSAVSQVQTGFPNEIIKPSIQDTAVFEARANFVTAQMSQTIKTALDNIIENGVKTGATYGVMHDQILTALGIDPNNPINIGFRAERIARNEAMFGVRTGMLQEFEAQGIQYVDLVTMADACQDCIDVASGNPYTLEEAVDFAGGIHVNCRCVLQPAQEEFARRFSELNRNDIMKILNL